MGATAPSVATGGLATRTATQQFLTFSCDDEDFGVDILRVREIKGWSPITQVPEAPDHVLGILNLRGDIVPVIDLRQRFGLERRTPDSSTVLIVVSVQTLRGESFVGLCVDGVSDVQGFDPEALLPPPDLGVTEAHGYVDSVVTRDSSILMILDIDKIVGNALSEHAAS